MTAPWAAPRATGPVRGTISLPGSKSWTNRCLILAALADRPSCLRAPLRARDTELMAAALRALGAGVSDDGPDWVVRPNALQAAEVDVGLAGTVMRFVPPVAALAIGPSRFDGDAAARTRPMGELISALRTLGIEIENTDGFLPLTVHGTGSVRGGTVQLDASASSQFVSALLLAAPRFDLGLTLRHAGQPVPSMPHIEMTVAALRAADVIVDDEEPNVWRVDPGPISGREWTIEPDLSNAAPFLAAAVATGGIVCVPGWPDQTTQAGAALRGLLTGMGAQTTYEASVLTITGPKRVGPLVADLHDVGELTPVLAALCALAEGESELSGVAHLRGHETDRLAALATELARLGARVTPTDDGLQIAPAALHGATWRAHADHRMAQAGAVLGLAVDGVVVDDISSTSKTMPDFPARWAALIGGTA